jgi:regulatory protein
VPEEGSNSPSDNSYLVEDIKETRKGKVRITLSDGSFFFILKDIQLQENVYIHSSLSENGKNRLLTRSEELDAERKALHLLSYAPHSKEMLKAKLKKRGFSDNAIKKAIKRIEELGYLDDKMYAENWLSIQIQRNPKGKALLLAELLKKGIAKELALECLSVINQEKELELAYKVLKKILKSTHLNNQKIKIKQKLHQRGFPLHIINKIVNQD